MLGRAELVWAARWSGLRVDLKLLRFGMGCEEELRVGCSSVGLHELAHVDDRLFACGVALIVSLLKLGAASPS